MTRRAAAVCLIVSAWLGALLLMDVGVGIWGQRALGLATWIVLVALLRGESRSVRVQVAGVVVAATALEYTASPLLGLYTYRLHNVPAFVPPGHGLVYLAALTIGGAVGRVRIGRFVPWAVLAVGGGWALWGITVAARPDAGGGLLFACLAVFLLRGRAPLVYAGAFLVTSYLELLGTSLGNWAWAPHDFLGVTSLGNPPSGISGAYCVLDAIGMACAVRFSGVSWPQLRPAWRSVAPAWARGRP